VLIIKSFLLLFFKKEVFFFEKKKQKTFNNFWPLLPLLLSSCGNLPRPFAGNPGANAIQLATPPVARLAVLTPRYPGFDQTHAKIWAGDIVDALVAQEMPAMVGAPSAADWSVLPSISRQGYMIVPHYELHDGTGKLRGIVDGTPQLAFLWRSGDPAMLQQSAQQAAPKIGDMLTGIEAARMEADPNSLMNRAARVRVVEGHGASGDGDQSLPAQIRLYLKAEGIELTDDARTADYTLKVEVSITDAGQDQQQVQIVWIVTDAQGREAGRIAQLNDVPSHSLDGHWGEVAEAVAQQAAPGVAEVMSNRLPARKNATAS